MLITPDYQKPFKLHVDASDYEAGAVLLQESAQKLITLFIYFSQKFDQHQCNYCTCDIVLILALQYFDFYLSAVVFSFEVFIDHNPLVFLNKMRDRNQRLLRWSLMLKEYNLKVSHIRGMDNVIADALSRK